MKWLNRLIGRRSLAAPTPDLLRMFDAAPSLAGVTVSAERALGVPAVYSAVSVLAQDVAKTPIKLRRQTAEGTFVDALDHDLWEILADLPNPETTAYDFVREMTADLLVHEHAYAQVVRAEGRVVSLWRLSPDRMRVDRDDQRRKTYRYTDDRGKTSTWTFDASRPPVLELRHPSPLRRCRGTIATAIALQEYTARYFGQGAHLGGVLQTDRDDLETEDLKGLREQFEGLSSGLRNSWKPAILTGGLKWQAVSAHNDQSQLTETWRAIDRSIAAAFRLAPWKVGDMESTSYSNMEAGAIEHATGTLDPYFRAWSQAIRRDLLTTRQFGRYDVQFDLSALLRADTKSLHEALARGRDAGYYSVNDVRRKLGENPIPADQGGDLYLANANLVPLGAARPETQP